MVAMSRAIAILMLLTATSSHSAWGKAPSGLPERDYTIWGAAYVDGVPLSHSDTGYTISLKVNDEELASYTMGSEPANDDWYVLRVPMSLAERLSGTAQTGDTAYIYINSVLVVEAYQEPGHESIPHSITVGNPAETIQMSIYIQIIMGNPPMASDLMITPQNPGTDDDLMASYTYYDEDQDPESQLTEIRWYRNSDLQEAHNDRETIPSTTTLKEQVWHFTVRPHDGFGFGALQASDPVTIGNSPPSVTELIISPDSPVTNDDLAASYTYSDADDDPENGSQIIWYRDGVSQHLYDGHKVIPFGATEKGQGWYFTVTPRDGTDFGQLQTSPTVTVGNTRPVAINPYISPASPLTGDDLVANYEYSDADGDPEIGTIIRWYESNDLQAAYNDQKIVPSSATEKDQEWHFTVRPDDGTEPGRYQTSPVVTIGNTPPVANAGDIYEGDPGEELSFDGSGSFDADDDPLTYSWDFDDGSTGTGETPSHVYNAIGTYIAKLIVNDGAIDSEPSSVVAFIGTDPGWMQQVAFEVLPGWNLISIRTEPIDSSLSAVLSNIEGSYDLIYTYQADTQEWLFHIVGIEPSLNTLNEVVAGKGYWLKMNDSGMLIVNGMQILDPTIELEAGWNLVGCNSQEDSSPVEEAMSSIVGKYNSIWTYDPGENRWFWYIPDGPEEENNLRFILPCHGYWIDAKEECWWDISQ
jgi:hypothetical protein